MEFKALLNELKGVLPTMAIQLLPYVLSEKTQQHLCKLGQEDSGRILSTAIEQINSGSVETIDTLTQKILSRDYPDR